MGNVVKRKGLKLNNQNLIVLDDVDYPDPDHYNKNHAYGHPINYDVAQMMIKDLWDSMKTDPEREKKPIAFAVGKEALLSILSQEDCIGVRFYLANFNNDFFDPATQVQLSRLVVRQPKVLWEFPSPLLIPHRSQVL